MIMQKVALWAKSGHNDPKLPEHTRILRNQFHLRYFSFKDDIIAWQGDLDEDQILELDLLLGSPEWSAWQNLLGWH